MPNWSNSVCFTLWSCFCSLLTSNWEVTAGRLHCSFITFIQIAQKFVISSYIDDIETNLPIGKHTLRVIQWQFEKIVGKCLFRCFIYVVVSICCNLCPFQKIMLLHVTFCPTVTHTFKGTDQKWQTGPNEPALHFEVVLVVSWHQNGKLVQVVYITVSLILPKLHKSSSKIRILNILK